MPTESSKKGHALNTTQHKFDQIPSVPFVVITGPLEVGTAAAVARAKEWALGRCKAKVSMKGRLWHGGLDWLSRDMAASDKERFTSTEPMREIGLATSARLLILSNYHSMFVYMYVTILFRKIVVPAPRYETMNWVKCPTLESVLYTLCSFLKDLFQVGTEDKTPDKVVSDEEQQIYSDQFLEHKTLMREIGMAATGGHLSSSSWHVSKSRHVDGSSPSLQVLSPSLWVHSVYCCCW